MALLHEVGKRESKQGEEEKRLNGKEGFGLCWSAIYIYFSFMLHLCSLSFLRPLQCFFHLLDFPCHPTYRFFPFRFDSSAHIVFYVLDSYAHICILCTPCSLHFFLSLIFSLSVLSKRVLSGLTVRTGKAQKKSIKKNSKKIPVVW